ncbi:MAG: OmpA family protein, partial [Myxococcales bacterium]|nr:OmpA family protein [Myxococcales bacterium]
ERVVEAPPTTGALGGQVLDATTKKPISGARVDYTDAGRAAQLTDAEGRFAGYLLPAGAHALRVSAEGYHPATANAMVLAGGDVVLDVALTADPAARKPAEPPPPAECPPAAPAKPAKPEKPEKPERFAPERPARKPRGLVDVSPKRIRLRRGLTFTPGTAKLTAADREVLDALAKALADQPKINRVRIAAHTDNRGEHDALIRLSNDRARSVQSYLVQRGVAAARLQARGFGPDKPVAPNLTARGRARNDRVEFLVLSGR